MNFETDKPTPGCEWLDLKALTRYACVSERTVREWIHRRENPLPAVRVEKKILIRRSEFDRWLEMHPVVNNTALDIDTAVEEILAGLKD